MKDEKSSHLGLGLVFGALIGAAATYLIVKNQDAIQRELEKVKDGVKDFAARTKNKIHGAQEQTEEAAD